MIRFVIPEVIPLIKTAKEFVVVESVLELISETGADTTPFTFEVKVLVVVDIVFEFTKLAVVVEITPFTLEVSINAFVVVAIDIRLDIVVVGTDVVDVTPFTVEVSIWVEVE